MTWIRQAPLRRTPLKRTAVTLARKAPARRTRPAVRRRVDTGFTAATRTLILDRDEWTCWRCGRSVGPGGFNLQHRASRNAGGTTDPAVNQPANGLVLCGSPMTGCHAWVETHPAEARRLGYAVASWADPATVLVLHAWHGWMLLTPDGGRHPTAAPTDGDAHTAARRKASSGADVRPDERGGA